MVYCLEILAFLEAGFAGWFFFLLPLTAAWALVLLSVLTLGGRLDTQIRIRWVSAWESTGRHWTHVIPVSSRERIWLQVERTAEDSVYLLLVATDCTRGPSFSLFHRFETCIRKTTNSQHFDISHTISGILFSPLLCLSQCSWIIE